MYGKGDKAGIALEDPFDCGTLGKVSMIVFEGEYDSTAAALALGFFDCIAAKTVARPANARGAFSPGAAVDFDFFGDYEGAVEADTETAYEVFVGFVAFFKGFEKGFRAGVRDSAEVLDRLLACHTDSKILDGQGS